MHDVFVQKTPRTNLYDAYYSRGCITPMDDRDPYRVHAWRVDTSLLMRAVNGHWLRCSYHMAWIVIEGRARPGRELSRREAAEK